MAKLSAAQILAVFGMAPTAAVAYLEQKGLRITGDWHEMLNEEHAAAYTVANCAKLDVLQDLFKGIVDATKNGSTERDFIKQLTPLLQSKGWWGKEVDADGNVTQLGSPRRLQTIYRTNLQSAYMSARYREMVQGVASHPYWKYISLLDGKTRPSHRSMNGRVFKWDDPVWQFAFPPNGYNCRCRVVAISQRSVDKDKLEIEDSTGRILKKEVQIGKDADGNPLFSDVMGIKLPTTGDKFITLFTDPGFDVNQGMAATEHAARIFANKVEKASPSIGAPAMTAARDWLMPQLTKEYANWASGVIESKIARNGSRVVGAMTSEVLAGIRAAGVEPVSAAITLRDAELLHLVRDSKALRNAMLSQEEVLQLPDLLAKPTAVLWDAADQALIYLLDTPGQTNKVVIRVNYTVKLNNEGRRSMGVINGIRSAGRAEVSDLKQYIVIEGSL